MKRFNYRAISLIRELVTERGQQAFFKFWNADV